MTHPDFRALCAELLAEVEALNDVIGQEGQADLALIPRARAALAAPVRPELIADALQFMDDYDADFQALADQP